MKLMAIDYGEKRVGIASTDESGQFALPRIVLPNNEDLIEEILNFKNKEGVEKIVLGESKNLDGTDNPIMQKINEFKTELENGGVEVIFHPEVYTSQEARHLQGNNEMTDASAAALILKSYIDSKNAS